MLFSNLHNFELRKHFIEIMSRNLKSDIKFIEINIKGKTKAYVFSSETSILSVYEDKEELFIPHNPKDEKAISNSIDGFNKLCNRNFKIVQICDQI